MCHNIHMLESEIEEHIRGRQRDGDRQRMMLELSRNRRGVGKVLVGGLGAQLVALGLWMERIGQHPQAVVAHE